MGGPPEATSVEALSLSTRLGDEEGARAAFAEAACAVKTIAAGTREDNLREGFLGLPGVREVLEALPPAEPGVKP